MMTIFACISRLGFRPFTRLVYFSSASRKWGKVRTTGASGK